MSLPTYTDVVLKTREVANREPAKQYTLHQGMFACRYWVEGCPDCLFGHVLHELGIPETPLVSWARPIGSVLIELRQVGLVADPTRAECMYTRWLRHVQRLQDARVRWSECVRAADGLYSEVPR